MKRQSSLGAYQAGPDEGEDKEGKICIFQFQAVLMAVSNFSSLRDVNSKRDSWGKNTEGVCMYVKRRNFKRD